MVRGSGGHVWKGRHYSCPLDRTHWEALRYKALNPVRAVLAADAGPWEWPSAAVHCGGRPADGRWRWRCSNVICLMEPGENILEPVRGNRICSRFFNTVRS